MPQTAKADRNAAGKLSSNDPAQGILDVAEQLAQTLGYNGFSYADIAERLGVTKASLHYHFASKADLGSALIARYQVVFAQALEAIEQQERDPAERLQRYVALYDAVMSDDRMCLCGMLAAEYATLPRPMQAQLKLFFDANERWLTAVLEAGSRAGRFGFKEAPKERAQVLLGALEGAMLVARSYGDPQRFRSTARHVLEDLGKVEVTQQRKAKAGSTG
ncbi:MAG TPA: TetR/AcrR family transcriptional regulator [Steroidobacteraceae bacterium]